jgi:hypothetical protein
VTRLGGTPCAGLALEVIDGASHFIADERPDGVVGRALEFFTRR